MTWPQALSTVGISGVLCAAIAWLTRSIIVHWLSKDVERYKLQLQLAAEEHKVRFSRLQEKQAEVIGEFYWKLQLAQACAKQLKNTKEEEFSEQDRELAGKTIDCCIQAMLYFHQHALYFEEALYQKTFELINRLSRFAGFYLGIANAIDEATARANAPEERRALIHREMLKGWRECDPQIDEILDALKKRFRELLGVTKPEGLA